MSDERRNPVWPSIVAVLIGVPVLYLLLFGPACWLAGDNETAIASIQNVYYPILWTARFTRREVNPGAFEGSRLDRCLKWYATLGRRDGAYPSLHSNGGMEWYVPEYKPGP